MKLSCNISEDPDRENINCTSFGKLKDISVFQNLEVFNIFYL